MTISNLEDLFLHELKDVYDAERRLLKALSKMTKKVTSEALQATFEEHAAETEEQISRLERVFEILDKSARGKKCAGMEGLIKEGDEFMKEEDPGAPLDAALIGAAQKAEHYEIAAYGTLVTYARMLELDEAAELLEETLTEEKEADRKLTEIASEINFDAQHADEEEEEEEPPARKSRRRQPVRAR